MHQNPLQEMHKFATAFTNNMFEQKWHELMQLEFQGIVKKNFVRQMFDLVMLNSNKTLANQFGFEKMFEPQNALYIKENILNDRKVVELIYFYHLFYSGHLPDNERTELQKSDTYKKKFVEDVSKSVFDTGINDVSIKSITHASSPEIIAYITYCNDMLFEISKMDFDNMPNHTRIIIKQIQNVVLGIKGLIKLLAEGQSNNAIVLWRHAHEQECLLSIFIKHGQSVVERYLKHNKFSPLNDGVENKELEELLDVEMKNVKAKNKRDFINYGWLFASEEYSKGFANDEYRLNFKNGLEKFAGRSDMYGAYSKSSEITHATSTQFSADPLGCYLFTIKNTYLILFDMTDTVMPYFFDEKLVQDYSAFKKTVTADLEKLNEIIHVLDEKYSINGGSNV
jgi:hypothetical protein